VTRNQLCLGLFGLSLLATAAEYPRVADLAPEQWKVVSSGPAGKGVEHRTLPVRSSREKALEIRVPKTCPVSFYQYVRDIQGVVPGEEIEFTGQARVENVSGGVGAFLSIGALGTEAPVQRIVANDSERLTGTGDWTQVCCALVVPESSHTLRLLLLLHGRGAAVFKDLRLRYLRRWNPLNQPRVRVTLTPEVTTPEYLGFGVEDDCFFFTDENFRHGITPEDIALRNKRITELAPSVIATLFWWNAFCPTHDLTRTTYDTELMRALVQTLAVHQEAGRKVFFSDAHWGWSKKEFPYSPENLEKGVAAYVDLFKYLIRDRGLTCIRFVSITGEPDLVFRQNGGTFASYVRANRLLRKGLDACGLQQVRIICDKTGGLVWFRDAVQQLGRVPGIHAVHEYPDVTQYRLIDYRLEQALDVIAAASPRGTEASRKKRRTPVFLWEIGYKDQAAGDNDNHHSAIHRFDYGLLCANTAISGLNHGLAGGSVWCLHSMFYPGQNRMDYGLWEFKDKGWEVRPFYYAYGLFTRFARAGLKPIRVMVDPDAMDFRAGALTGKNGETLLFLDNLSRREVAVDIHGVPQGRWQVYEYAEDRLPRPETPGYATLDVLRRNAPVRIVGKPFAVHPRSLVLLRGLSSGKR